MANRPNDPTSPEQFLLLALDGVQLRLDAIQSQINELRNTFLNHSRPRTPVALVAAPEPQATVRAWTTAMRKQASDRMKKRWRSGEMPKALAKTARKSAKPRSGWPADPKARKAEMARRVAARKPTDRTNRYGWPADPEERKAEMRRRMAARKKP